MSSTAYSTFSHAAAVRSRRGAASPCRDRPGSVRHRVQKGVDAKGVPDGSESKEVLLAVALALEGIAEVGVVGDQHEDASALVQDSPHVWLGAVDSALGRSAARRGPEVDRRNLRDRADIVEHVKEVMIEGHIDDREAGGWKGLLDLFRPDVPGPGTP